ncbi:MAG: GAF domain-containing protein [Acidimicrobiales bacterium]
MITAALPLNESDRLEALDSCGLLDSDPEVGFDSIARHAAQLAQAPTALISLVSEDRQWFKARYGFGGQETPRDLAFCAHAILDEDPLVVEDATLDERFRDNPLVTDFPHIRFYAGFPIHGAQGHTLGTLCVIDTVPRSLDGDQLEMLTALAMQVDAQIELRDTLERLDEARGTEGAVMRALSQEARTTYDGVIKAQYHLAKTDLTDEQRAYIDFGLDSTHHLAVVLEDVVRRLQK